MEFLYHVEGPSGTDKYATTRYKTDDASVVTNVLSHKWLGSYDLLVLNLTGGGYLAFPSTSVCRVTASPLCTTGN